MHSAVIFPDMEIPSSCFACPVRMKVDPDTVRCLASGERFEETYALTIERRHPKCPMLFVSGLSDSALVLLRVMPNAVNMLANQMDKKIVDLILYGPDRKPREETPMSDSIRDFARRMEAIAFEEASDDED